MAAAEPVKTALELAQEELAESYVPHPDEFLRDYTPQAALLFVRQCAMVLGTMLVDAAMSLDDGTDDAAPVVNEVLAGGAAVLMGATHALVALGVLPPEAEEAAKELS